MKIGTRTAISYFAVIMVVLAFTTSSILLLQYGKNIDIRIASSFSPVISAIKDYQFLIEETGRLSTDISIQQNEVKREIREKDTKIWILLMKTSKLLKKCTFAPSCAKILPSLFQLTLYFLKQLIWWEGSELFINYFKVIKLVYIISS